MSDKNSQQEDNEKQQDNNKRQESISYSFYGKKRIYLFYIVNNILVVIIQY